jgi:predicted dehydrogenase
MTSSALPSPNYRVAVVGAGRIAAGYDRPGDAAILTHAHAIHRNPRLRGVAIVDAESARSEAASAVWGIPGVPDLSTLLAARPDIVIVATPTATHSECLLGLLEQPPRVVLCEKPLTASAALSAEIVLRYAEAGVALAIDHQRRFDPSVVELRRRFAAGELGSPVAGAVWYSKGIRHNGSHAVDLLRFLFGEVRRATARRRVLDHGDTDATVAGTLEFADVSIELIAADERHFSLFEIDLLFARARYRFTQGGMMLERYEVRPDPLFPGHLDLLPASSGASGLASALAGRLQNIVDFLDGVASLEGTGLDAVETQRVCEQLHGLSQSRGAD